MLKTHKAFTLIELLVVISIIALLIGILLPVLGTARGEARSLAELAAGRQLQTGHLNQALERNGQLLPGINAGARDVRNHLGSLVGSPDNARYPWRMADQFGGRPDGTLLVNGAENVLSAGVDENEITYRVSIAPTFGYNVLYVGGDTAVPTDRNLAVQNIDDTKQASNLIGFASAHRTALESQVGITGHFYVFAPTGVPLGRGGPPMAPWADGYDIEAADSAQHGYVHARHQNTAVFTYLDGHADRLPPDRFRDMRLWSSQAQEANDPNWSP